MRIITGTAKGMKLKAPRGMDTRPTADRVKESIFNILGCRVVNAQILDLFAGTGNLGLEALSRGGAAAIFVDNSGQSVSVIRDNLDHTKMASRGEILKSDVLQALGRLAARGRSFDLIFCDPPYNRGLVTATLSKLNSSDMLSANGIIVIEHSRHELINNEWDRLTVKRTERYGETLVSFLIGKDSRQEE